MTTDPVLTTWAADCAEHGLSRFAEVVDPRATEALAAARAWAAGTGTIEAADEAAWTALAAARDLDERGYRAAAVCVRAAAEAAASAGEPDLAEVAAGHVLEALRLNSAICEEQTNVDAERRWQYEQLPSPQRDQLFPTEPPLPGAASCAI